MADDVLGQMRATLKSYRGFFVGENHGSPFASNFMLANLRALKEDGVTTLYIEHSPQKVLAEQGGNDCRNEYVGLPAGSMPTYFQMMIENATALGLRVIGYDPFVGTVEALNRQAGSTLATTQWATNNALNSGKGRTAPENMDFLDKFGASVIEKTYDGGKFVAYGGWGHSSYADKSKAGYVAHTEGGKGIDEILGIPSFNFYDKDLMWGGSGALKLENVKTKGAVPSYAVRTTEHYISPENLPAKNTEGAEILKQLAVKARETGACTKPVTDKINWDQNDIEPYLPKVTIPVPAPDPAELKADRPRA